MSLKNLMALSARSVSSFTSNRTVWSFDAAFAVRQRDQRPRPPRSRKAKWFRRYGARCGFGLGIVRQSGSISDNQCPPTISANGRYVRWKKSWTGCSVKTRHYRVDGEVISPEREITERTIGTWFIPPTEHSDWVAWLDWIDAGRTVIRLTSRMSYFDNPTEEDSKEWLTVDLVNKQTGEATSLDAAIAAVREMVRGMEFDPERPIHDAGVEILNEGDLDAFVENVV